ncbi:MAG: T9SS type A sorting domain-containing protein, partial [Thermoflexibacter sp.]|nr:T9SS type A sorting domain-containing protein [Thermoflexibacter sp.]
TTQVATWQGLIFEKSKIVGIQLIDNNLQGSIPDVFVEGENILTNLRTMNLAQNHITGEIPPSMTFLNNLEYLDISNNLFKGSFSPNIFNIKNLITLWISNNQLDKLPNGISKLSNLKNLFLNNNQLSEVSEDLIGLSNLEILNLQSNQLNILPQNLGNLQKLKFLDISNNELKDLPESINAIQTLEVLLAHNNFFKTISKNLLNLKTLNKFTIYNNALEFGSLEPLSAWWLGNSPKDVVYAPQTKIGKPQEALKQVGQNIAISFPTSGTSNQYLWYKNNEPTNITMASFVIENLKASDVGTYTLQVRNSLVPNLILNSENFVLLVDCNTQNATNRPQIQIDGSTSFCGEESINTRFTAISPLNIENYQWLLNGAKIGSATEQSYSVKEAGRYRVQIFTKDKCTYTSEEVVVTVSPSYAVSIRRNGDILEAISERNLTNFEWFFNNTLLPTETQKNLIARESGSYFVRVRDGQGCPSTSRTENIMITGIKENEIENNIVIFPNPSQDLFYLKTENETIRQIKVFDVLGKQINDILFSTISNDYMISLKNQSIGMYWLKIHTDKRIFIKKIVKE